eukprot:1845945-Rhodomonas_salina.2
MCRDRRHGRRCSRRAAGAPRSSLSAMPACHTPNTSRACANANTVARFILENEGHAVLFLSPAHFDRA